MFFLFSSIHGVPQIKDKQSIYSSALAMLLHLAARGADRTATESCLFTRNSIIE